MSERSIDGFRQFAILVEAQAALRGVEADPGDDEFVECALAGGATFIISGDSHLLKLKEYQGIQILTPAAFLTAIREEQD
ncbi:MAG: hypothetical protein HYY30_11995 [Chloroflexi bacterium]|nr:hypothetical protein [Chloroflexota bacterium]